MRRRGLITLGDKDAEAEIASISVLDGSEFDACKNKQVETKGNLSLDLNSLRPLSQGLIAITRGQSQVNTERS